MECTEIEAYLDAKDRWIVLGTIGPDGFPHQVPQGYFRVGEHIVMGCKDGTQKIANIERNPRVSLLWENGRGAPQMIGIMIRGYARVVRDDEERLALKTEACRQSGKKPPASMDPSFVYIEVSPTKTISWNRPSRHAATRS